MSYMEQFNYLRNQAKFSMKELIPFLEKKISKELNYEYVIRPWICDFENMSEAKMYYMAIPRDIDNGIQVAFTRNNKTYIYETIDKKHDLFYQAKKKDIERMNVRMNQLKTLMDGGLAFILTEKNIKKNEIFLTMVSDSNEEYYLFNEFFVYPEHLSFLNKTIEEFAHQKVKTPID